jgi:hypothetical protein
MRPISDALELLTAQHEEIEDLLATARQTRDPSTFAELADKLVAHLALEQELFYPVVATAIPRDVLEELAHERVAIKRVLAEIVWLGADDPGVGTQLNELAFLLAGHCSWQEQQLFETVAESMSSDTLSALGTRLQAFDAVPAVAA